ncbi:MAG: hypothetical protein OXI53_01980 [Nitrospira sp.]|nr:hypothetical protein [Nitrospira sp.]
MLAHAVYGAAYWLSSRYYVTGDGRRQPGGFFAKSPGRKRRD